MSGGGGGQFGYGARRGARVFRGHLVAADGRFMGESEQRRLRKEGRKAME